MSLLIKRGAPPKDYDIPSTIVVYVLVILLGVGMCFCLRRANRLLPNQLSFQLRPTQQPRRGYDIADEEEGDPESRTGLLSEGQFDHDDDQDDRLEDRRGWGFNRQDEESSRLVDEESEEEEFGDMQGAPTTPSPDANKPRTPLFNIADDDDESDNEDARNKRRL